MKLAIVIAVLGAAVFLAWVRPGLINHGKTAVTDNTAMRTDSASTALLAVKKTWRPGRVQKGVGVYIKAFPDPTPKRVRYAADVTFEYAVRLGANSVSLSFPFFKDGLHGNKLYGTRATPPPWQLRIVLEEANRLKLRVTLRPLMDETDLAAQGGWRGSIHPSNPKLWFANYRHFLQPYLRLARADHVATFSIGAEFNSLGNYPNWTGLIRWAKTQFPGQLIYTANWDSINSLAAKQVDTFGIDAYFATHLSDKASVAKVTRVWDGWLGGHIPSGHRKVSLSEVGIAAEPGAYLHPWYWGLKGKPLDLTVQKRWFIAACRSFRHNRLAGIYFWRVNFGQDPKRQHAESADHGTFVQRPATSAIKQCFQG